MYDHAKAFATKHMISTKEWTITASETTLLVTAIPRLDHATALSKYLTTEGMLVSVAIGDRQGETWVVFARMP